MVIRASMIIPEMQGAFFKCTVCHHCASVEVENGRIAEPMRCLNCNMGHGYQLIHNRSTFTDKQLVKLQESPGKRRLFMFLVLFLNHGSWFFDFCLFQGLKEPVNYIGLCTSSSSNWYRSYMIMFNLTC